MDKPWQKVSWFEKNKPWHDSDTVVTNMSRFIWVSHQSSSPRLLKNQTTQLIHSVSHLSWDRQKQALTFKRYMKCRKNWLPFKLSLQSRHWPHNRWPVEAGIRASWCHSRSEAVAVVEAQTCSSALHLQWVAGGEEIRTTKVSPTHTHMHTFTLLKGLGLRTDSIHTVLNALCDYQWSKSIIYMSPECRLMHFRKLSVSLICLWEERWCVDVCVCVGVYGVV